MRGAKEKPAHGVDGQAGHVRFFFAVLTEAIKIFFSSMHKVGDLAAEIVDMDARVGFLEEEVKASEGQIMPFIQGIDDDQTRIIFRLRFLRGLAWKEVATVVGGNTEESAKRICYRYLSSLDS